MSQNTLIFIILLVSLIDRGGFDLLQRRNDFSSRLCVQNGSGAHPASYTMGTGGPFPGGKALTRRDADHSPLSSAEAKNE
jgi:hypothetical protein